MCCADSHGFLSPPPRHRFAALSSFQIPPGLTVPGKARHSIELPCSPSILTNSLKGGQPQWRPFQYKRGVTCENTPARQRCRRNILCGAVLRFATRWGHCRRWFNCTTWDAPNRTRVGAPAGTHWHRGAVGSGACAVWLRGLGPQPRTREAISTQLGRGAIIVWWAVRILSGPPRSLSNLQISRRRPRRSQLAGSCGCLSVSAETFSGVKAILGGLALGRGIPFPRCRSILDEDWCGCDGYHTGRPSIWR
jgi:hypothetical protein